MQLYDEFCMSKQITRQYSHIVCGLSGDANDDDDILDEDNVRQTETTAQW